MERAKFRWLRFASLLGLGVATLSVAVAGERHRVWVDPPSDSLAEAAPDDWSDPAAKAVPTEAATASPRVDARSDGANDQPAETGSIAQPEAVAETVAKAPGDGSDSGPDEQASKASDATKEHNTRTASREDPPVAEPVPARRSGVDRQPTRAAPRHAARRAHHRIRRSAGRTPFIQRLFGPPKRGTHVISTGSIR